MSRDPRSLREGNATDPEPFLRFGSKAREALVVCVLLLVSAGFQSFVLATHRVPINSDQAVVGLMAKHILEGKGHPVFYYGATYAGSLEPHYVALVFALAGVSQTSYRIAMALLLAALVLGVFLLARKTFGRLAGLIALAYLSVAPFFLLYKVLTSDGAYGSVALLALVALTLAFAIDRRLATAGGKRGLFWMLGLVIGLGWWVTPVTAAVSVPVLGWLWIRRNPRPGLRAAAWVLSGVVLGSFPWWFWNMRHAWGSLRAPELGLVGFSEAAVHLTGLISTSLPTLEGGIRSTPDPTFFRETFPLSRLLSLAALIWIFVRARRVRRDHRWRLLCLVLAALFCAASLSGRLILSEPRYLVAYYAVAPLLIGAAVADPSERRRLSAAFVILLVLHAASVVTARVSDRVAEGEVTGSLESLESFLQETGIRSVYTDYWTAYRLSFESGEDVIATPLPGDELVRYVPYQQRVDSDPSASIVLLEARSVCFEASLRQKGIPHRRSQAGPFGIYSELGEEGLKTLRNGLGLPLPRQAHRVAWLLDSQPATMVTSQTELTRVEVSNRSPCQWPISVHLGYHWWPMFAGGTPVYESSRGFLQDRVQAGGSAEFFVNLVAPATPGRYRLEYDLVQENIEWFSNSGGQTASTPVNVISDQSTAKRK